MAIVNVQTSAGAVGSPASSNKVALSVVTTLFFMWGFVTVLNDVLVPHLKSIFDLNYARVMLIQFAFFSAYFLFSIPSAKVIDWIGYKKTMVAGLFTMGLGALLFIPAASVPSNSERILGWVTAADRMRVKGVGWEYSELLRAVGVKTVNELKFRNPEHLVEKMREANKAIGVAIAEEADSGALDRERQETADHHPLLIGPLVAISCTLALPVRGLTRFVRPRKATA